MCCNKKIASILLCWFTVSLTLEATSPSNQSIDVKLKEIESSLVIIKCHRNGKNHQGNGVVAMMDGKPYILTNQRFLMGSEKLRFTTASGECLSPKSVELSKQRDLARLALQEAPCALELSAQCKMNTPVALPNASAAQAKKVVYGKKVVCGKITGVGGTKFEISVPFNENESGTPVLNADRELIGITSYIQEPRRDVWKTGTRFQDSPRYFCSRIGHNDWKRVNWRTYNRTFGTAYRKHKNLSRHVRNIMKNTEQYSGTAKQATELASKCRTQAWEISLLKKQHGLTTFLLDELNNHAQAFQSAENWLSDYAKYQKFLDRNQ